MLAAMRFRIGPFAALLLVVGCRTSPPAAAPGPRFEVSLASGIAPAPLDGRLILIVSRNATTEPRLQVSGNDETAQIFGIDVHGFGDQRRITVGGDAVGYPLRSLAELPAGDYQVQAVLHRYETFHRADGHTVQLPMDRGEGQHWNLQPGNPMSRPTRVHLDGAAAAAPIALVLDHVLPALPPTPDTRWLKHVRIKSELLSRFWGRDIELGALVLVPEGWDSHPQAHYPVVIEHSHFERELAGWRETPPDPKLPPADLEALKRDCPDGHYNHCAEHGYERVVQEAGYRFYKQWTGAGFPRVLLVAIQHANPYYDDSYAVNSANLGPWGDAITHELIPAIEKQFRGLGPWARGMYGGSTGGWETLADQIFYPDDYNGAIANCPDPIDFRAYVTTDLYRDANAFYSEGAQRRTPRVASRDGFGHTLSTMAQDNQLELVLGDHSRSGEQFDIWEAVFSPLGADGYPRRIFDKSTGVIDHDVAAYWRDHYDLSYILERDWATLGPKLKGKLLGINVGNQDSFFLDGAVRRAQARLGTLTPRPDVRFDYGERDGHCWSGDHEHMNFESRLTYHSRFIPLLVAHFLATAPKNADTKSWRY